jgi:hypothetical protein
MKITLWHFKKHGVTGYGYRYTTHNFCVLDDLGVWFMHKGTEVCWRWPWRRKGYPDGSGRKLWIALVGGFAEFDSLADIDRFWAEYFEACAKEQDANNNTTTTGLYSHNST